MQYSTYDADLSTGVPLYNGYYGFNGATLNNYPTSSSANKIPGTATPLASLGVRHRSCSKYHGIEIRFVDTDDKHE
jgi:hypothetical protein